MLPPEHKRFDGFGECELAPNRLLPTAGFELAADDRECRRAIRAICEPEPGVYGMIDAEGQLIYVGKSKSLRNRLLSYFAAAQADSKPRRIIARTRRLVWEPAPHEFTALVRELELIRRWRPRFNVRGQPRRLRRYYICLGRGPAAYAYLAAKPSQRSQWVFGPVRSRWGDAVRRLNDCFELRDCSDRVPIHFANQLELFVQEFTPGCLRHELGACLGPCAAACTSEEYESRVLAARNFLRGSDLALLDRLEAEMFAAAEARQFERAAHLRDVWQELSGLADHLESLREARERFSFVYPLPDHGSGWRWYFVRNGRVAAAIEAPRNRRTAGRCLRLLEQTYSAEDRGGPQPREDLDMLLLVTGWFRQYPEELERTISPDSAAEMCRGVAALGAQARNHAACDGRTVRQKGQG